VVVFIVIIVVVMVMSVVAMMPMVPRVMRPEMGVVEMVGLESVRRGANEASPPERTKPSYEEPSPERYNDDAASNSEKVGGPIGERLSAEKYRSDGEPDNDEAVGKSDREAQYNRIPPGTLGPDEVGGGEGLSVARFEGVEGAQRHRCRKVYQRYIHS